MDAPPRPASPAAAAHLPARVLGRMAAFAAVLRVLVSLAWRNVWRNRVRSALTAAAMVAGLTLMIAYLALMEGMVRQMVGFATDITIGHIQLHRDEYVANQDLYALVPWPLLTQLEERTPYHYAPRLYAAGLASAGDASTGALVEAVDPRREARVTDLNRRVRRGRFDLEAVGEARPHGPDGPAVPVYPVVIGNHLARNLAVDVGGELVLITQAADGSIGNGIFRVVAVMQPIDPSFDRMGVIMSLDAFHSVMFLVGGAHEVAVRIDDVAGLDAARDQIAGQVLACDCLGEGEGGPVLVRTWKQINPPLHDMLVTSQSIIYLVGVLVFAIAAMGILNTLLMATYERRHELAILLSLGMGRWALVVMVTLEAFFLGLLAALVGSVSGVALSVLLQVHGFDYSRWLPDGMDFLGVIMEPVLYGYLLPEHVLISVAMTLVTALGASLLPAWRTARLRPAAALHQ